MSTANEPITELADEAGDLTQELLRRLELLAGTDAHEDISYTKYKALSVIHKHSPITVGKLGKAIGCAQSTTSEMVARLEKAGLVTRSGNRLDARLVFVKPTERGRQIAERYRRRIHEGYRTLVNNMSPAERDAFVGALMQLDGLLSKEDKSEEAAQANEAAPAREAAPAKEVAPAREAVSATEAAPARDAAPRPAESDEGKARRVRTFSVHQVSAMCRVTHETIRRWVRKYGLPAYNATGGLAIKITETDLREFSERLKVYVDWGSGDEGE